MTPDPAPDAPDPRPRKVGDFRILGVLGQGGMGTVYLAEQAEPRRRVALKVVRGGSLGDEETLALFRREVRALARLGHPGIAALYTSGSTADGMHYFAMELAEGIPLDAWGRGPADIDRRVEVVLRVCDAVAHAHAMGVIHRDLKPSNVFVRERPDGDRVKVLDFGLARVQEPGDSGASWETQYGTLRGTPAYMSPEQLSGDPEAVDVRSDVYALGVLLYELLAGRHPFHSGADTPFDLPRRILRDAPRTLPGTSVGGRRLDPDLATVVMKCLEKDPDRRYATVQALSDDLKRWRTGQPITARPPSTAYQLRKMIGRNRVGFALIVSAASVLVGLTAAMAVLASHLAAERDRANREAEAARANAAAFSSMLFQKSPAVSPTALDSPDAVATLVERIATTWEGDPQGQVRFLREAGSAIFEAGAFDSGVRFLERAVDISRVTDPGWATGEARVALGEMYHRAGRIEDAETIFRDVADRLRRAPRAVRPRAFGYAMENLGCALRDLGRLDEAESALREAMHLYETDPVPYPGLVASVHDSLGRLLARRGDLAAAEAELQAAMAIREGDNISATPQILRNRVLLGSVLVRRGRLDEAESLLRSAVAGSETRLGPDHPDTATALAALGELEIARGRRENARPDFERAARIYASRLSADHPDARALRERMASLGFGS